jgi:hypothetical protein
MPDPPEQTPYLLAGIELGEGLAAERLAGDCYF